MKTKKGQSAIELLILVGVMLFIFISLLFIFQQNLNQKSKEQRVLHVQEIALFVQNEINIAASARDGYERTFEIPAKVIGKEYNISVQNEIIYIRTLDEEISLALPSRTVNGEIIIGENKIRKTNGEIFFN